MLFVSNDRFFCLNDLNLFKVSQLPLLISDTLLFFKDLKSAEVYPFGESLLQDPLIPVNHHYFHVFHLKGFGFLSILPPVIKVLIEYLPLYVC